MNMKWPLLHLVKGYRVATSPIWVIEYSSPFSFFRALFRSRKKYEMSNGENLLHRNCVNPGLVADFSFENEFGVYLVDRALFFLRNLQDVGSERQAGRQGLRSMLHMCQEMGGAQPCGEKSIVKRRRDISKG